MAQQVKKPSATGLVSGGRSVTLKRSVTIKVIVTEKFKQYMLFEIEEARKNAEARLIQIDQQLGQIAKLAESESGQQLIAQKVDSEKIQLKATLVDLEAREKAVHTLALDSHFIQGNIDGFVSVAEGDNLYEKLGGMEILAKDGVIQKISPLGAIA
jgi:hypothetical protein